MCNPPGGMPNCAMASSAFHGDMGRSSCWYPNRRAEEQTEWLVLRWTPQRQFFWA